MEARPDPRIVWLLAGCLTLAGVAVFHLWVPAADPAGALCLSRRWLHLPCPACGMTRALAHLAKGDWSSAMADHPLAPAVALELILGWAAWGASLAAGRPLRLPIRLDTVLLANVAVLIALWLGRAATGTLPW